MDNRSDVRGTTSYAANALKGQAAYWVEQVNLARRKKGLPAVGISGKPWEQLSEAEKRSVRDAQMQDRLQASRDDAELLRLQAELKRLKKEIGES